MRYKMLKILQNIKTVLNMRCKKMQINMKQNSKKKNFLHKADRQNMPVCFITGKIYRKQEYEIKTETDCQINYIDDFKHIKFGIV